MISLSLIFRYEILFTALKNAVNKRLKITDEADAKSEATGMNDFIRLVFIFIFFHVRGKLYKKMQILKLFLTKSGRYF